VLEVWAYDRRTNFLEDLAGVELASAAHDPELALDWFFGAEVGLPLSPALTRRAVFHAGPDVAYGGVAGGYEVYIVEGYAHIDVVSSEDDADNTLLGPLHDFLVRNTP
jgi:hypothetical protein